MKYLHLRLVRGDISLSRKGMAFKRLREGSELRRAFVRACTIDGLDADSPHAEEVRELFESYGWNWMLEERSHE